MNSSTLARLPEGFRIVVVGNGMVGWKFCAAMAERGASPRCKITVLGDEPRPAYDRVNLTKYFETRKPEKLELASAAWYAERGIELKTGLRATAIDREHRVVRCGDAEFPYDFCVLATGSSAFVPQIEGINKKGVFVYRTIEDLEGIAAFAPAAKRIGVLGGGLLGLEAAKAVRDMGRKAIVIEFADRLMCRQVDAAGGRLLRRKIEALGVEVLLARASKRVLGNGKIHGIEFDKEEKLEIDMLVVSAGIRPRDELAKAAGLEVGPRGGIAVDDRLATSDPSIAAIGECALHRGMIYGLVAPGYQMAEALADRLHGVETPFRGADMSTKLKLMGIDVANIGDLPRDDSPSNESIQNIVVEDPIAGTYKRLILDREGKKLLGAVLVGDASAFGMLLPIYRGQAPLPANPSSLIIGEPNFDALGGASAMPDAAQVCSCNNVTKGAICSAIRDGELSEVGDVKKCTKAATGCGACANLVVELLHAELKAAGRKINRALCEHFACTRQELFQIVKIAGIKSFAELIEKHGRGAGCEICKPAVAAILASLWNENVFEHKTIQDTNDRFMANIQRQGTYSIVPRVPGGEITPDKLIVLGEVAKKYKLYCKITGGQRIDLFGARVDQLPEIWEILVGAGFESGHAYGKALRTVKSCVGTSWCRYGVQDSVGFAIRVEERYKGIRSPHKLKSAVSGCLRECAEARSKDFGYIATENGYNLYVCGNGGTNPRHAQLIASDLSDDEAIRLTDRFIMYYIHTADRLQRTADWLEKMEGGLDELRAVIVDDKLDICADLERQMEALVKSYFCEWKAVVDDPAKRAEFRHFANTAEPDPNLAFIPERGQRHPVPWTAETSAARKRKRNDQDSPPARWVRVARAEDVPAEGGIAVMHGETQIAIFHFASRGEWYATQNMCPHKRDMVLSRGLLGEHGETPKVACPMHKKTFSLATGACLTGEDYKIDTFPVYVENGDVFVDLPEPEALSQRLACGAVACAHAH